MIGKAQNMTLCLVTEESILHMEQNVIILTIDVGVESSSLAVIKKKQTQGCCYIQNMQMVTMERLFYTPQTLMCLFLWSTFLPKLLDYA